MIFDFHGSISSSGPCHSTRLAATIWETLTQDTINYKFKPGALFQAPDASWARTCLLRFCACMHVGRPQIVTPCGLNPPAGQPSRAGVRGRLGPGGPFCRTAAATASRRSSRRKCDRCGRRSSARAPRSSSTSSRRRTRRRTRRTGCSTRRSVYRCSNICCCSSNYRCC